MHHDTLTQVREVFANGSLGPVEKRKIGPSGAPVAAGKYKHCSSEELLQKVEHFRAQMQLLENKKKFRDEKTTRKNPIKLPRREKLQLRAARQELRELQREFKARSAPADEQAVPGDGTPGQLDDCAAGAAGVDDVGSSDEDDDDDE